jgi:hypothetical protein
MECASLLALSFECFNYALNCKQLKPKSGSKLPALQSAFGAKPKNMRH